MPAPASTDLADADLVVVGRMPWSSNATFLCELWPRGSRPDGGLGDSSNRTEDGAGPDQPEGSEGAGESDETPEGEPLGRAIYKPHRGERPLWDFPDGLYLREAAAFHLAEALGWPVVPETLVREGPFGIGSVQRFVEADFDQHYFTLLEDVAFHPQLLRMAAFDFVANSTDRKGGHVLVDDDGHLWGIDNGLCLHQEFKLRTVIWEFAGHALPAELADDLDRFLNADDDPRLAAVLDPFERDALRTRARALLSDGVLPHDPTGRRFPWPLV